VVLNNGVTDLLSAAGLRDDGKPRVENRDLPCDDDGKDIKVARRADIHLAVQSPGDRPVKEVLHSLVPALSDLDKKYFGGDGSAVVSDTIDSGNSVALRRDGFEVMIGYFGQGSLLALDASGPCRGR
jgi:hypothetical protein